MFRWRQWRFTQCNRNCFDYAVEILTNIDIPQPKNAISALFKKTRSHCVTFFVLFKCMLVAIKFDDQACVRTTEIDTVFPLRNLPLELESIDLPIA